MKYVRNIGHSTAYCIFCFVVCLSSCNSIKPVTQNNLLQTLSSNELSKLNGDYEIISTDSSYPTLARALTFTDKKTLNNFRHPIELTNNDFTLHINARDETHLRISVYRQNKIIKTKTIKGKLAENYFQFKRRKLSFVFPFYLILNLYKKQENRIGLTKSGDLLLDSYEGGALLLVVMPTFGGDTEAYNLIFKRKKSKS